MRQAFFSNVTHIRENFPAVPCKDPERHKELGLWVRPKDRPDLEKECWQCTEDWLKALPWNRAPLERYRFEDDEAMLTLIRATDDTRKAKRWSVIYRDCWGPKYPGYVEEVFGVVIQTGLDPEKMKDYPYWRLTLQDNPDYLIPVLRHRYCYEPTMNDCPGYLEIIHSGSKRDVSIKGMGDDYFNHRLLKPILEARELWFGLYSLENFNIQFGFSSLSKETRDRFDAFLRAAESLGADKENDKAFSVLRLCNNLETRFGVKSRDAYYKMIEAIKAETSEQVSEAAARAIKNAFDEAREKAALIPAETQQAEGYDVADLRKRAAEAGLE